MKLSASLKADYGESFKIKFLGNRVRIQLAKVDDFLDLKEKLFGADKSFHTFSLNSQKALVVVLKGLSKIPAETIMEEIRAQGLQPISCLPLLAEGNEKSPYCTYKVVFPQGTSFNAVSKIGHVFYTQVYWKKFFSLKIYTQCFRCQAFGHTSSNCNHQPRCVKCAGTHLSKESGKALSETPTCANCSGGHTANFSSCPTLVKFLAARTKQPKTPLVPQTLESSNNYPGFGKAFLGASTRLTPTQMARGPSYRDALLAKHRAQPPGVHIGACPESSTGSPPDTECGARGPSCWCRRRGGHRCSQLCPTLPLMRRHS